MDFYATTEYRSSCNASSKSSGRVFMVLQAITQLKCTHRLQARFSVVGNNMCRYICVFGRLCTFGGNNEFMCELGIQRIRFIVLLNGKCATTARAQDECENKYLEVSVSSTLLLINCIIHST